MSMAGRSGARELRCGAGAAVAVAVARPLARPTVRTTLIALGALERLTAMFFFLRTLCH